MKKFLLFILSLVNAAAMALYIFLSPVETVPSHYGFRGQADAFSSKWLLMLMPCILIGLGLLYMIFCLICRKKDGYQKNEKYIFRTVTAVFMFMLVVFWVLFLASVNWVWDLGSMFPMLLMMIIGVLMVFLSNMFGKLKQNKFLGIKLKATLSSENVWKKTHRVGGYLGVLCGIIMILLGIAGFFMKDIAYVLLFIGLAAAIVLLCVIPTIYAQVLYSKEKKQQ